MLWWHSASNGHSGILSARLCLLLLKALVVGHLLLLFLCHIPGLYARLTRHVCLLCVDVVVRDIFGRLSGNIGSVNTIFGGRFRRIQAGLTINQQAKSYDMMIMILSAYLNKVLALGFGHQGL